MAKNEKKEKKEEELTPQERSVMCQAEIQKALEKYDCSILARPVYRLRDDGTWSLVVSVEIIPNAPKN